MPSEAQWEYAARAGTITRWSFGEDEAQLGEHAWFGEDWTGDPHPVAELKPNPWGLFDVHGNVWEWVRDCWAENYRGRAEGEPDPVFGLEDCASGDRVVRGGSFGNGPRDLRSAIRFRFPAGLRDWSFGFRCVRAPRRQLDPSTP